jgi:hypothetical protein
MCGDQGRAPGASRVGIEPRANDPARGPSRSAGDLPPRVVQFAGRSVRLSQGSNADAIAPAPLRRVETAVGGREGGEWSDEGTRREGGDADRHRHAKLGARGRGPDPEFGDSQAQTLRHAERLQLATLPKQADELIACPAEEAVHVVAEFSCEALRDC